MDVGKPLSVVVINQGKPQFNQENLTAVFCNKEVRNSKVALISVNGPFRKGKSFILNMFLDFIKQERFTEWSDNISNEFRSVEGTRSVTKGLIVWSKPFIVEDNGEKICLFLMDTEGLFDTSNKPGEDLAIFALSTLLSSAKIYLFTGPLQTIDLECFEYFVQLARKFLRLSEQNPFQKLIFVLRDWVDDKEYKYGYDGGLKYLQDVFKNQRYQEIGKGVSELFDVECFLLPYPGEAVAHGEFTGSTKDISPIYLKELRTLAESLLKSGNVSSKIFHDLSGVTHSMTCEELSDYLKDIVSDINSSGLLDESSLINSIIANGARLLVKRQIFNYSKKIKKVADSFQTCDELKETTMYDWLKNHHTELLRKCVNNFIVEMQILGNSDELQEKFLKQLSEELDALYNTLESDRKMRYDNLTATIEKVNSFVKQQEVFSESYKKWLNLRKVHIKYVSEIIVKITKSRSDSLKSKVVKGIAFLGGICSVSLAWASMVNPVSAIITTVGVSAVSSFLNKKDKTPVYSLGNYISCWVQEDENALKELEWETEKLIFSMKSLSKSCEDIEDLCERELLSAFSENSKEGLELVKDYRDLDQELISAFSKITPVENETQSNVKNHGDLSEQAELVNKLGDLPKLAAMGAVQRAVAKSFNQRVKEAIKENVESNRKRCEAKTRRSGFAKSYADLAVRAYTVANSEFQLGKSIYELSNDNITLIEKFLNQTKDRLQNEIENLANICIHKKSIDSWRYM